MAIPYKTIARIKKSLTEVQETTEKSYLILYHLNVSTRRTSMWSERNWIDPEETAKVVWEAARQYAESQGGPQRFELRAYDATEGAQSGDPIRSCVFVVDSGFTSESDALVTEPPTSEGLMAQLMRHNQEMFRNHNAVVGALTHHLARTVEKQAEQIDRLMADRQSNMVVMEELFSKKHERDMEVKRNEGEQERKKAMFEKVMELGPIAINKIAGKEILRQKSSALEATVSAFLNTITPQHLDAFAASGILSPHQLLLFSTVLEQATKTMQAEDVKKEQSELARNAVFGQTPGG